MEEIRDNNQEQQTESGQVGATQSGGGVRTSNNTENVSNPINSGGESTIDTENKAAVAQTRNPTERHTPIGTRKFITGTDGDGQV